VVVNEGADALVFKQVHGISLKNAIKRLIKSLIQKPLASFRK